MKKLYIIADWVDDTLSCAEVKIAINGFLKNDLNSEINFVSSTPSTIHTGFLISQLVEDIEFFGKPLETVIFQNTDTRLHTNNPTEKAEGSKPLIIRLKSGIYLLGPNCGYNFSFVKEKIEEVFEYVGVNDEGQFHSRDLYARISAHLMDYLEDELDLEERKLDIIPSIKGFYIAHIDNFGNIKTTITHEDLKGKFEYGEFIEIKINNILKKAKYVNNLFGGFPGELVIYPGSSGPKTNRFIEITAWQYFNNKDQKTGKDFFNNPLIGSSIEILNIR